MRGFDEVMRLLKAIGFTPGTVLDVGACYGTPNISGKFPSAFHIWFEPIAEVAEQLRRSYATVPGEVHVVALGDAEGEVTLRVPTGEPDGASVISAGRDTSALDPETLRKVQLKRLDSVLAGRDLSRPILLKTDCQGFDLAVLHGAAETLRRADVAVIESHMFPSYAGAPDNSFDSIYQYMRAAGFSLFDIADPLPRPKDGVIAQIDVFFIRDHGEFPRPTGWV